MEKIEFIIQWAKESEQVTTYQMDKKVSEWCLKFYPNIKTVEDEKRAIINLRYYFNKLAKKGILYHPHGVGLGAGAKNDFFGTTTQYFWKVNKIKLDQYPTPLKGDK